MSVFGQNVSNLQFRVETLVAKDRRNVGRIKPDSYGYYDGVPIALLGAVSQNNTYYDIASFQEQLTSPNTFINKVLTQGKLYGEYGHPNLIGLTNAEQIERLSVIREQLQSHHISAIYSGETLASGGKLLLAKLKPHGYYGSYLKDNLDDPYMNTSFSLRAITSAEQRGNVSYRVMKKLVTFDSVNAGGYMEAAKSYSPSVESFDISITSTGTVVMNQVALECYTDTELNELFGIPLAMKHTKVITYLSPEASDEFRSSVGKRSFYMDLIRKSV